MTPKTASTSWYPIDALSKEWLQAGRRLGQPGDSHCVETGCYSMAFVALRTGGGNRTVCFRHYVQLDEASFTTP